MKKILAFLLVCFVFMFIKCSKSLVVDGNRINNIELNFKFPSDANEEARKVYPDSKKYDYELAVIENPNFGIIIKGGGQGSNVYLAGATPENLCLSIDGIPFKPHEKGQWWKQDTALRSFYGKNVKVKLNDEEFEFYVPKAITAKCLSHKDHYGLRRKGNILRWQPDPLNATKKVMLHYYLSGNDSKGQEALYETDVLLLNDNGEFNFDPILKDKRTTKFFFQLWSRNGVVKELDGKKLFFYIGACDQHEYEIRDDGK